MIITGITPVLHAPQFGLLFIRYQTATGAPVWCARFLMKFGKKCQKTRQITGLTPVLHAPQLGLLFIRYQTGTLWLLFGGGGRRGFGPQS